MSFLLKVFLVIVLVSVSSSFNPEQDIKFLLFTRRNPLVSQELKLGDLNSVKQSNYNPDRPTRYSNDIKAQHSLAKLISRLIVHGWMANSTHIFTPMTTEAYLQNSDVNVIAFDWGVAADDSSYIRARSRISAAGVVGANFLDFLLINGLLSYVDLIVVGYSLGAHLAGFIGKNTKYGSIGTIIGLEPAGPLFDVNNPATRLAPTDAHYVENIHTNGGGLGIFDPIGHADFYPNGNCRRQLQTDMT
jgi:pancreatic triacylglycerol lipase